MPFLFYFFVSPLMLLGKSVGLNKMFWLSFLHYGFRSKITGVDRRRSRIIHKVIKELHLREVSWRGVPSHTFRYRAQRSTFADQCLIANSHLCLSWWKWVFWITLTKSISHDLSLTYKSLNPGVISPENFCVTFVTNLNCWKKHKMARDLGAAHRTWAWWLLRSSSKLMRRWRYFNMDGTHRRSET